MRFFFILPDTPRYIEWTIANLLFQTGRKNPLVYKGLNAKKFYFDKHFCVANM